MAIEIKKKKEYKSAFIGFRLSEKDKNRIQLLSNLYANGNISTFVLLAATEYEIKMKDLDSEVYGVLTSKKDTVIFDYGLYSLSFKETIKVFSKEQVVKYDSLKMDTKDLKWSKFPEIDQNQAVFHNSYYSSSRNCSIRDNSSNFILDTKYR